MQLHKYRDFGNSLNLLYKKGGKFQKAAQTVYAALGLADSGQVPLAALPKTNFGETRLRHCVKYDLTGYCRLVTVQTEGYCILLYCGTHDDCDQWLDRNRGLVPVVNPDNSVSATFVSESSSDDHRIGGQGGHSLGPLYKRLPETFFDQLVAQLPRSQVRALEELECSSGEGEIWGVLAPMSDDDLRMAVYDVFALLRQDKVSEAIQRVRLFIGEVTPLEVIPAEDLPDVVDSQVIKRIDPGSPIYAEALKRFMASARYRDWMLFMHPEQEAVVAEDFDGPAKLVGVSGSGKTCVVVQRAVRLARSYPTDQILVLTLNRALANLIDQLVADCATTEERQRIQVRPFFLLCRELMREMEPWNEKLYDEVTWKHKEHVDEIWQEYYRCEVNNYDARALQPVHDSLLARGWNPERYLREEIDWLRSALLPQERERYMEMQRTGRTVPLLPTFRRHVLEGTKGWEQKMTDIGVVDGLGIAQALTRYRNRIRPRYRCVLVDEAQDFGNVELELVRMLVQSGENDIFICGDAAQAVTTKYQSLRELGLDVPRSRSRRLSQNYRNSQDVLEAAYHVLLNNMTTELMDREDFEILDPEFSSFTGATPLLLQGVGLESELGYAMQYSEETLIGRIEGKACIAICGFTLNELTHFGESIGMPVLDGQTDIDAGRVFLSDLEQTKGFEFDTVCVVNCRAGILPSSAAPDDEQFRDLARLYVAMTRAKTNLVLSWSGAISPFLEKADKYFYAASWEEYADGTARKVGVPILLEDHRSSGLHKKVWQKMTGEEFLYSGHALGLSPELIARIRELVDGVGLRFQRETVKWATMGSAAVDFAKTPKARQQWGPAGSQQFAELIGRLEGSGVRKRA